MFTLHEIDRQQTVIATTTKIKMMMKMTPTTTITKIRPKIGFMSQSTRSTFSSLVRKTSYGRYSGSFGDTRSSISSLSSSSSSSSTWQPYEKTHGSKIVALPEYKAVEDLSMFLKNGSINGHDRTKETLLSTSSSPYQHQIAPEDFLLSLDAAMSTFLLHVNARIASLTGQGFYTIGPCGEELLSAAALSIQPQDSTALHYRHTAISMARQLHERMNTIGTNPVDSDKDVILDELLLGRARGYTVSRHDPVTGGVHCSIGGGDNEFLVTSTLSSQCPPAVGRALGYALRDDALHTASPLTGKSNKKAVSFVTLGDGSLHNHHFLSSLTLARHAKYLNVKCPVVFGISDNGISISYETKQYVDSVFPSSTTSSMGTNGQATNYYEDPLIPVFQAHGQDLLSVFDQTKQAIEYSRKHQSPCVILYKTHRRFGHAATDRQNAYLDEQTIQAAADTCVLEGAITQAVEVLNLTTYAEISDRFEDLRLRSDKAFGIAIQEPKVTLEDMLDKVCGPLAQIPASNKENLENKNVEKPQVMRKNMTRVLDEALSADESVVYLGEDVRHGGYYLVTDGLAKKFPKRILDFPPDETTLLGAALGFSQLGLIPIVEIPYAKYLDCGADMFYEIAVLPWLSPPTERSTPDDTNLQRRGMIIRLQGFDRGLFGGNFHTHNSLSHIPPGIDVVCFSNGEDYVRGFRHALWQAKHGRIVMLVDCTHLLNIRHVHDKDRSWEYLYPSFENDMIGFDQVYRYTVNSESEVVKQNPDTPTNARIAIISYGNGVVTSLQARRELVSRGDVASEADVDVIDCPYISGVPAGLEKILVDYDAVLFADICKEGPGSNVFSSMIASLNTKGLLPKSWRFVGAPRTYNPLGSTVTFLNKETIEEALMELLQNQDSDSIRTVA